MLVSWHRGYPQIIHLNRIFHWTHRDFVHLGAANICHDSRTMSPIPVRTSWTSCWLMVPPAIVSWFSAAPFTIVINHNLTIIHQSSATHISNQCYLLGPHPVSYVSYVYNISLQFMKYIYIIYILTEPYLNDWWFSKCTMHFALWFFVKFDIGCRSCCNVSTPSGLQLFAACVPFS